MGNRRSGRRRFLNDKITVESCMALDIVSLTRQGLTRPGTVYSGGCSWCRSSTGTVVGSIDYSIDMTDPHVRLHYSIGAERFDYCVELVSTCPNYGGLRWWFFCPATVGGKDCQRRVGKLYRPPGGRYFACRHCYRLSYTSQREDGPERTLAKAQAIQQRLGGSGSISEPFPPKPKGMWWRTYHRLRARSQGLWLAALRGALAREPK